MKKTILGAAMLILLGLQTMSIKGQQLEMKEFDKENMRPNYPQSYSSKRAQKIAELKVQSSEKQIDFLYGLAAGKTFSQWATDLVLFRAIRARIKATQDDSRIRAIDAYIERLEFECEMIGRSDERCQ